MARAIGRFSFAVCITWLATFGAAPAEAVAPQGPYRTIVSPAFRVHYPEHLEALADEMSTVAEAALPKLVWYFGEYPDLPIHIVISREIDGAQGLAQVLPQNIITLFTGVPEGFSELGDYDDFMRLLLVHELAHVVHLNQIYGIPAVANEILGKVWAPGLIQPRFMIEGIATDIETQLTAGGRSRSVLVDMIVRNQILAGRFPPLDELVNINRRFNFGSFPWILGGRFFTFVRRTYGDDRLAHFMQMYGERPVPYGFNLLARRAFDKDLFTLWAEWKADEEARAAALLAPVFQLGVREGAAVTRPSPVVRYPRFGPGGRVALVEQARDDDSEIVVIDSAGNDIYRSRTSLGRSVFVPGKQEIVAEVSDVHGFVFRYNDLERIDLKSGLRNRRTFGARLRAPDVSPDGKLIVAEAQQGARSFLMTLTVAGDDPPRPFGPRAEDGQLQSPRFSPDGRSVVASRVFSTGARNLVLLDSATGEIIEALTTGLAHDIDPCFGPNGDFIYFASDRGEIFNIHRVHVPSKRLERVTNVRTGAFEPTVSDRHDLMFVQGNADGYELRKLPLRDLDGLPTGAVLTRPESAAPGAMALHPTEDYDAWESLLPKSWLPTTGVDGLGNTFGLQLVGEDALGQHNYTFNLTYGIESERLGYGISYSNRTLPITLGLSSSLAHTTRPGRYVFRVATLDRLQSVFRATVAASIPFHRWDASHGVTLRYTFEQRSGGLPARRDDPFGPIPNIFEELTLSTVGISWNVSTVRTFPESISPASGVAMDLSIRFHEPTLGSDLRILEASGHLSHYLRVPWADHHVLATRFTLAGAAGTSGARAVFALGGAEVRNILADAVQDRVSGVDVIRGYRVAQFRGNGFYLANVEYRLPLWVFASGVETVPLFFDRLHAAIFSDLGNAFVRAIDLEDTKVGVGAELRLDLRLGYLEGLTMRLGYGRGLMEEGTHNVYWVLGGSY